MTKKTASLLLLFIAFFSTSYAQSVDDIKGDPNSFLWGEGSGMTLKRADNEALSMLISQISTQVESNFTLLQDETISSEGDDYKQKVESVVKTYSSATLKNTERIILGDEPDARVFRYIKREEVVKIFMERRDKIIGFVKNAEKSKSKNQIADALRYYYWALTLLKSHPNGTAIKYTDDELNTHLLLSYIPLQMNNIFADIDIYVGKQDDSESLKTITLDIRHKNQSIDNFDYTYWDGKDWSNIISAKNGLGFIELYGMAKETDKIQLKAEYIFEGEARIDRELEEVLNSIDPIPFRQCYFNVTLNKMELSKPVKQSGIVKSVDQLLKPVKNTEIYDSVLNCFLNHLQTRNYTAAKDLFTLEAFDVYNKLINYGNAVVLDRPQLNYVAYGDQVICRAIPMRFSFNSNNKEFVEQVVLYFNEEGKIEDLSFSLSKVALNDIIGKDFWNEYDRMTLVNFLEHYKTAYALKRINFIERIFSDDALIITGSIVKVKPNDMNNFNKNKIIKYNRQTKQQYIRNLRHMFNGREYVNLKFEESKIRKAGKGGDIYGVQIKQNFYSSNYGDVGYLFLMVDLNNPKEPVIHVRTWQPDVKSDSSVYGLSDFN